MDGRMFLDELDIFPRINVHRAGVKKHFFPMDSAGAAQLCYFERGFEVVGQPSLVFVHGFSSNKGTWLSVIKVRQQCLALLAGVLVYS